MEGMVPSRHRNHPNLKNRMDKVFARSNTGDAEMGVVRGKFRIGRHQSGLAELRMNVGKAAVKLSQCSEKTIVREDRIRRYSDLRLAAGGQRPCPLLQLLKTGQVRLRFGKKHATDFCKACLSSF